MLTAGKASGRYVEEGAGAASPAAAPAHASSRVSDQAPDPVADARLALAIMQAKYAQLAAAARASVAAAWAGTADPLVYVEAELARYGGLPPRGAVVLAVLADARAAMTMAGRAATV